MCGRKHACTHQPTCLFAPSLSASVFSGAEISTSHTDPQVKSRPSPSGAVQPRAGMCSTIAPTTAGERRVHRSPYSQCPERSQGRRGSVTVSKLPRSQQPKREFHPLLCSPDTHCSLSTELRRINPSRGQSLLGNVNKPGTQGLSEVASEAPQLGWLMTTAK